MLEYFRNKELEYKVKAFFSVYIIYINECLYSHANLYQRFNEYLVEFL